MRLLVLLAAGLPALPLNAQSLTTTYSGGNSNVGVMFDIQAEVKLQVTAVQIALEEAPLTAPVQVYTRRGTYVGNEATPAAWTLTANAPVTAPGPDAPTSLIIFPQPVTLLPSDILGIYVRRDDTFSLSYTDGDGVGTLEITDGNLSIFEGTGVSGNFGGLFPDRIPNVTVYFNVLDASGPLVQVFGNRRILSSLPRQPVFGIATDDQEIQPIRVRFQRLRSNGSKRTVSRLLTADTNGIFRFNVRVFEGRNRVRFNTTDPDGVTSNTATVVVIGQN